MRKYSKLIAGLLGTVTPQAVMAWLDQAGVAHAGPWWNLVITTAVAAAAIYAAPKNAPAAL